LIKAEHIMQYRFYIAICIIEEKMPGVLRVPLCNDGMSSAHVPLTASHLVELLETVRVIAVDVVCILQTYCFGSADS